MSMSELGESPWPIRAAEEGWHRLKDYAHSALTYFKPDKDDDEVSQPRRWGALATDVVDHDKVLEVRMEVPGVKPEDLKVTLNGRYLTITGERRSDSKRQEGTVVVTERAFGRFQRVIPLSDDVLTDKVKARCRDGVLVLKLPKRRPQESSRVEVPVE